MFVPNIFRELSGLPAWILRLLRFRGCFRGHQFKNHLVFMNFQYRIFVVFALDKISKGMLVTIEKELGEYFQLLHFWNQWAPLIKMHCRVCYLFDFDLKIRSGQVCSIGQDWNFKLHKWMLPKREFLKEIHSLSCWDFSWQYILYLLWFITKHLT